MERKAIDQEPEEQKMEVRFIGSGDAFGSGGQLQPCILVRDKEQHFALDLGLTALIGLRKSYYAAEVHCEIF